MFRLLYYMTLFMVWVIPVMADRFGKYKSVAECRARKITDEDGETIITANGAVHADHGSYEVHINRAEGVVEVTVVDGETFEKGWSASSGGTSKSRGKSGSQTRKKTSATKTTASKRTSTAKR